MKETMTASIVGATALIRAKVPAVLPLFAFVPLAQMSTQQKRQRISSVTGQGVLTSRIQ